MNTPNDAGDDTINQLWDGGAILPQKLNVETLASGRVNEISDREPVPLYVHPDEFIAHIFQTLHLGGYSVVSDNGRLVVMKTWRMEAERRRREGNDGPIESAAAQEERSRD